MTSRIALLRAAMTNAQVGHLKKPQRLRIRLRRKAKRRKVKRDLASRSPRAITKFTANIEEIKVNSLQ